MTTNQTSFREGNTAARKHGMSALEESGPASLEPRQVNRLQELRVMVRSQPGRLELRHELAARLALIVDLWFAEIGRWHEAGRPLWESPAIKRGGTYVAELRRQLDAFPPDGDTAADLMRQVIENDRGTGDRGQNGRE